MQDEFFKSDLPQINGPKIWVENSDDNNQESKNDKRKKHISHNVLPNA